MVGLIRSALFFCLRLCQWGRAMYCAESLLLRTWRWPCSHGYLIALFACYALTKENESPVLNSYWKITVNDLTMPSFGQGAFFTKMYFCFSEESFSSRRLWWRSTARSWNYTPEVSGLKKFKNSATTFKGSRCKNLWDFQFSRDEYEDGCLGFAV
jgi:hypothetical protein